MTKTWTSEVATSTPTIELAGRAYLWSEHATSAVPTNDWGHHGVVVDASGDGFIAASPDGQAFVYVTDTDARRGVMLGVTECHGMSVDAFDGDYSIWVADHGEKYGTRDGGERREIDRPGQVLRVSAEGSILQTLEAAKLPEWLRGWRPTDVTSEPAEDGGRVWVADGYGTSYVHCFSRDGEVVWSDDGNDSGTAFDSPHAIIVDTRRDSPELLVADRGNKRIVALDLDGRFLRTIGLGELSSPSGFAIDGNLLWVTELFGAIVAFDPDDRVVARLGDGAPSTEVGWPNTLAGDVVERTPMPAGMFRSPHGIAVTASGVIAVTEWVIGGRLIVLRPLGAQ